MDNRVNNIISLIANEFHRIFDADVALLLFGSRANNTANPYSDIDLAIQHTQKLDSNKMRKFQNFIDDFPTLYSIDLIDMNIVSVQLKKQIEFNNRLL